MLPEIFQQPAYALIKRIRKWAWAKFALAPPPVQKLVHAPAAHINFNSNNTIGELLASFKEGSALLPCNPYHIVLLYVSIVVLSFFIIPLYSLDCLELKYWRVVLLPSTFIHYWCYSWTLKRVAKVVVWRNTNFINMYNIFWWWIRWHTDIYVTNI